MKKKIIAAVIAAVLVVVIIVAVMISKKANQNQEKDVKTIKLNEVTRSVFYAPQYIALFRTICCIWYFSCCFSN